MDSFPINNVNDNSTPIATPIVKTTQKKKLFFVILLIFLISFLGYGIYYLCTNEEITIRGNSDNNGNNSKITNKTCTYNGKTYEEGESFPFGDSCNKCVCEDGNSSCTKILCEDNCLDSNEQCQGKEDGASCDFGVWCDEKGVVCGGDSCGGMAVGVCLGGECKIEEKSNYEDWKTFTSEEFNFSFKYTSTNPVNVYRYPPGLLQVQINPILDGYVLHWDILANEKKLPLNVLIDSELPKVGGNGSIIVEFDKKVGNLVGTWVEYPGEQNGFVIASAKLDFFFQDSNKLTHMVQFISHSNMVVSKVDRESFVMILKSFSNIK